MFRTALTALTALTATIILACAPPQPVGWYDTDTDTTYIDPQVLAHWEAAWPGMGEWWVAHEDGHRTYLRLFQAGLLNYGPGIIGQERGAQCAAEAALGHGPVWTDDAAGYWDCPDSALTQYTAAGQ